MLLYSRILQTGQRVKIQKYARYIQT